MKMKTTTRLTVSPSLVLLLSLVLQASAVGTAQKNSQPSLSRNLNAAPASGSLTAESMRATSGLKFTKRLVKEKNVRRKYTVDASYPQLVGAKNANAVKFNRAVQQLFMGALNDFKKNVGPPDFDIPKEVQWSSFDAGYSIEYNSPDLVSISFGVSNYYAGAAHPLPYSMALNYDLKAGRTLSLFDLFRPRSNHLQVISDYAVKALMKELGENAERESIESGAAPDSKNYKSWNITPRGLSITFDAYQVAAYAFGEQVVLIPYVELRQVINMDGPLGRFVKK